jgi:uncharacterized membrane protein YphA (DoxX/SURF4 family)
MNTALWIVQVVLALGFLASGVEKLVKSRAELVDGNRAWAADFTDGQVKAIGILEILATAGLIVPAALDIIPILTAVAAAGLVALMGGAIITHVRRAEAQLLPINFVLGALALFVAIARVGPAPLARREAGQAPNQGDALVVRSVAGRRRPRRRSSPGHRARARRCRGRWPRGSVRRWWLLEHHHLSFRRHRYPAPRHLEHVRECPFPDMRQIENTRLVEVRAHTAADSRDVFGRRRTTPDPAR